MIEEGKYIYAIIKENTACKLGSIGINNREVQVINFMDLGAVVSNSPVINFDRLEKKELMWLVSVHQKVNEILMKDYDVVPMAFGTITPNINELMNILGKGYLQFKLKLEKIKGRAEFVVQVRCEKNIFFNRVVENDAEIQQLKQRLISKPSILKISAKLKLGKLIQQKVESAKQICIQEIRAFLKDIVCDCSQNKIIEEDMIANFSFLIERGNEIELDKKLEELNIRYADTLRFKCIGPMPPYSFTKINFKLNDFDLINEAKELLGLADEATPDEIKNAYHALAHQYHPDKYQDNFEKEEQMKKISRAYAVLVNYCQSHDILKGRADVQQYSFREEDVKNSVCLKRSIGY